MKVVDLITIYLDNPTRENLNQIRSRIREFDNFNESLDERKSAVDLINKGQPAAALDLLTSLMPGALLSPSTHRLMAQAHQMLKREQAAERENALAQISLASIFSTGSGTQEDPWSVLRVADEYDVLDYLDRMVTRQSVLKVDGKMVDRFDHPDGAATWFILDV